jgi:hypothetical protein
MSYTSSPLRLHGVLWDCFTFFTEIAAKEVLVVYPVASAGQRYSMHNNECEDRVYFSAQFIFKYIIV